MRSSPAVRRSQTLLLCAALLPALAFACSSPTERTPSAFQGDDDGNSSGGGDGNASSSGAPTQQSSGGGGLSSGGDDGTSSSSGEPAVCATSASVVERQPVYLDILLDDSGSMNSEPKSPDPRRTNESRGDRWIAAREALLAYFEAQSATPSPRLGVGLDLFNAGGGRSPSKPAIAIATLSDDHTVRLHNRLIGHSPSGATPLRATLLRAMTRFDSFQPSGDLLPGGRKAILLITDGTPTDDENTSPRVLQILQQRASDPDNPIVTAVVGVGNSGDSYYDPKFLSKAAYAGGLAAEGCDLEWTHASTTTQPCHFQITPRANQDYVALQADLAAAIDAISARLVSCELPLDVTDEVDPATTNVVYTPEGGAPEQLTADSENGYSLDDPENPSKVILHGQSCEKLKQGGEVQVVLGCPAGHDVIN